MLRSRLSEGLWSVTLRSAAAIVLVLAACAVDNPEAPTSTSSKNPTAAPAAALATESLASKPVFTPYTHSPRILNKEEAIRAMARDYPPLLREAGIGGTAVVWLFIDAQGNVIKRAIRKSTGHPALDSAALRVTQTYRFSPATNRGKTVPVWVQIPITFGAGSPQAPTRVAAKSPAAANASAPTTTESLASKPVFTPYTKSPQILNRAEVVQAMARDYPSLLRDAGIGGTSVVLVFVGTDGTVERSLLAKTSGHPELDSAALKVMKTYRFSPAMNRDKTVPVWIQIPITFETK